MSSAAASVPASSPRASILIVDDTPGHLLALEGILLPLGQRLVRATSGREALRRVLDEDFAAVLMDMNLGDMTGVEVLGLLRERERSRRTPVLLMTAGDGDEKEWLAAYAHGAVDYLRKPLRPEILLAKVSMFVELHLAREAVQRREESLRERERDALEAVHRERLHAFFMQAPVGISITRGPDFVFELANPYYELLVGRRVTPGQALTDVFPEMASQPEVMEVLRGVVRTRQPFVRPEFEVKLVRDGQPDSVFFNVIYHPMVEVDGTASGIITLATDVTEFVRARRHTEALTQDLRKQQAALADSEQRLRLALTATALGTFDMDVVTGELRWDARCKALFGLPQDSESSYELFLAGLHVEDRDAVQRAIALSWDPTGRGDYDVAYRTVGLKDGVERWVRATGRTHFHDGKPVRFVGTVQDITARKRADAERTRLMAGELRRTEQLRGLSRASLALNAAGSVPAILELVTLKARKLIGANQSFVRVADGRDAPTLGALSAVEHDPQAPGAAQVGVDERGLFARVCQENRPLRLTRAELRQHAAYSEAPAAPQPALPLKGFLAVPLVGHDGRNLGLMQVSDKLEGDFDAEDETIAVQLAQMASVALENARLYETAQAERRNLFAVLKQLPAAITVLRGPELVFEMANDLRLKLTGSRPLLGLTVRQALPELNEQGQVAQLEAVYRTGETYRGHEVPMRLGRDVGQDAPEGYFNLTFQPLRNAEGKVDGIVSVSWEVTEQVLARRRIEALAAELKEREQQFRTLADSIPQLSWMAEPEGRLFWFNQRWYDYTGTSPSQVGEKDWSELIDPEDAARVLEHFNAALREGTLWEDQFRLRRADGSYRWFLSRARPVRDGEGRIVRWFGTNTDIDDERRTLESLKQAEEEIRHLNTGLEKRVRERTAQLQEANKELESFSYSVSHDLRAPLRHITGFAQLLERRAGAKLDDVAKGYLSTIAGAAKQGGTLVDDLLAFSRMGRAELRQSRVDLGQLVEEARRDLMPEATGRQVEWRVGSLPTVEGDPSLLRQVIHNLLANALKYTRPKPEALIEVGARETEGEVAVWVRDNGVGFEMQYVDKLFGVFQRLHTAEEFEGTGIGLANVRRIVSRHGGRTWAEGAVGQGASFTFTLPRASPVEKKVETHA
ncbi:PAS domain-containing protein [Corallococcus exiguus]|uniref:PAS domain-containing protein n=1 Tax=Corallococcus TaxID=83461 RepID=UPI000F888B74|nr:MULTISPECIES: PAS domain-containing protein [Corallococcus]NNC18993.1 PAS domain-containing protein [Corallococcus exiguus]RUO94925.1 PAS domain S-box protein [Corallococcus sp. AB018]